MISCTRAACSHAAPRSVMTARAPASRRTAHSRSFPHPGSRFMPSFSFLDREHSVAEPGYSRWLVPPAALAIHLSIGQAYAFSVFKIPMTTLLGITAPSSGDWRQGTIAHLFQVAIAFLGVSAA